MLVTRALICGLREMSRRVCKHLSKHAREFVTADLAVESKIVRAIVL